MRGCGSGHSAYLYTKKYDVPGDAGGDMGLFYDSLSCHFLFGAFRLHASLCGTGSLPYSAGDDYCSGITVQALSKRPS